MKKIVLLAGVAAIISILVGLTYDEPPTITQLSVSTTASNTNNEINPAMIERNHLPPLIDTQAQRQNDTALTEKSIKMAYYELSPHLVLDDGIPKVKNLNLYNVNTDEEIDVIYSVDGNYVEPALTELDNFMRDWRKNQITNIDRDLYDLLHNLQDNVETDNPIYLTSGYRSNQTNNMLRQMGIQTARKSQHVKGKAADITIPGVSVRTLRKEAVDMEQGGVGYYPDKNYIHVDTGPKRQW